MGERTRIIEEIVKCKGYKIALFTTFNFEIDFFERAILSRLYDNGIKKISIFADANEFDKSLSNIVGKITNVGLGKKYIVSSVSLKGSFHPKMVLLLGDKKAKLIIMSANITTHGYERNNEVFNVIEYSENNTAYHDLIFAAMEYFKKINSISYNLDGQIINELSDFAYYRKSKVNGERYLISNFDNNIIDQLNELITDDVYQIRIAVPYYDKKIGALKELSKRFPKSNIELYVQQGMSTYPEEYKDKYPMYIFDRFLDVDASSGGSFYHGKVFLFKTKKSDYILYGSANCTYSALIYNYKNGGNIEADYLDVGECGAFDIFFDNMHLKDKEELRCKPQKIESINSCPFRFISAEIKSDGVECIIKNISEIKNTTFYIDNYKLDYYIQNDEYVLSIPKDEAEKIPFVFDLTAQIDTAEYKIHCWVIDRVTLNANRKDSSDKNALNDFDIESDGSKYLQDRLNLLKAEMMCLEEVQEYKKMKAIMNQQQILDEEDDSDDDFIVDAELHYEYKIAFRKYSYVERIRSIYLNRFLTPALFYLEKENSTQDGPSDDKEVSSKVLRKPTTEEKRFERFVKRRVKGLLDFRFVESVSFEHYLGIACVVVDIFNKYKNVDLFTIEFVVKTKVELIKNLLSKDITDFDNQQLYIERLIIMAISVVLENYSMISERCNQDEKLTLNGYNKDLLLILEKKYKIRNELSEYLSKANNKEFNLYYKAIEQYGAKDAEACIDGIFGYKNDSKLNTYIKSRYGNETNIYVKNKTLYIETIQNNISFYLKPDSDVIREVMAYKRNTQSDYKDIIIVAINGLPGKGKYITRISNRVTLDIYRRWSQTIEYSDGKKVMSPSKVFN